ncbi:ATP-binding protein [Paenibacillus thailandensis]|uniref:histidine kinase n=1 Tax=Paenibacillus thailandensis TaxID=393250 RepID=A0ABW5QWQ1_9BACL
MPNARVGTVISVSFFIYPAAAVFNHDYGERAKWIYRSLSNGGKIKLGIFNHRGGAGMKGFGRLSLIFWLLFALATVWRPSFAVAADGQEETVITEWQMSWAEERPDLSTKADRLSSLQHQRWFPVHAGEKHPVPEHVRAAWIKIKLPAIESNRTGLYIKEIIGQNLYAYIDGEEIYSSERDYVQTRRKLLLSLTAEDSNKELFVFLSYPNKSFLVKNIIFDEYRVLQKKYLTPILTDIILGSSLILISLLMLFCLLFIGRSFHKAWSSLAILILTTGLIIIGDGTIPYLDRDSFGQLWTNIFDQSTNILPISLFIFLEAFIGRGPKSIISKFIKIASIVGVLNVIAFIFDIITKSKYFGYMYHLMTFLYLLLLLASVIVIAAVLLVRSIQKNNYAIIISGGLLAFLVICSTELFWFYLQGQDHRFYFWKWGALVLISCFIYVLGKMIYDNFRKASEYAQQLEIFNIELQKSGKMEVISQLAASVAHEVRNPLQVTRGFLQLIGSKNIQLNEKNYMALAINELDRATEIINDFLSFAKPQKEEMTNLNLNEEFQHIIDILTPMARQNNGSFKVHFNGKLWIRGVSSKFKQAIINIIKNSIEALPNQGKIEVFGYIYLEEVYIVIKDNGEGMTEDELRQLGKPYFSKKDSGTGLGLMVSFNIIKSMDGDVEYNSVKGKGTQVTLKFPMLKI